MLTDCRQVGALPPLRWVAVKPDDGQRKCRQHHIVVHI
jgi:hypothetical protein